MSFVREAEGGTLLFDLKSERLLADAVRKELPIVEAACKLLADGDYEGGSPCKGDLHCESTTAYALRKNTLPKIETLVLHLTLLAAELKSNIG